MQATAEQGGNDPNGPFNIAVAASNSATGAKVVWVNCPNMLNSKMNSAVFRRQCPAVDQRRELDDRRGCGDRQQEHECRNPDGAGQID